MRRTALLAVALMAQSVRSQQFTLLTDWPETNGEVRDIEIDAVNGIAYIGGDFTLVGGLPRERLAAIDLSNGAVLPWAPAVNGSVRAIAIDGGVVHVGGQFTAINGTPRSNMGSVDAATGATTAWDPNANSIVHDLLVHGGKLFVGGVFSSIGGVPRSRIAAFDLTDQSLSSWAPGANLVVNSLAPNGSAVLAGGNFTVIGGSARERAAELDMATGNATSWTANANGGVNKIAMNGMEAMMAGSFTTINGTPRAGAAMVSATDGSLLPWAPVIGGGGLRTLARIGDVIVVGGFFTSVNGTYQPNLAAVSATTGGLLPELPGTSGLVGTIAIHGDLVLVGGVFSSLVPGGPRARLAAFRVCFPTTWFQDADGDGFGNASVPAVACTAPSGYVANDLDCDDNNILVTGPLTWYADSDGDGHGDPAVSMTACTQPLGFVVPATDCDDSNAGIFPGAPCDDGDPLTGNDSIQPVPDCACAGVSTGLSVRLFLQGPYSEFNGMMADDLRIQGLVPLTEPYTALGYHAVGSPSPAGSTIDPSLLLDQPVPLDNVVDWVILELRDGSDGSIRLATRYVLVKRSGHVIDLNGSPTVRFPLPPGNHRLAALHRNHKGIVMAQGVPLHGAHIDFTHPDLAVHGGEAARANIGFGRALINGDVTFNDDVKYVGANNDRDPILTAIGGIVPTNAVTGVYSFADVNMDGTVRYTGANNDRDRILVAVGGTTPSNVLPNLYLHTTP